MGLGPLSWKLLHVWSLDPAPWAPFRRSYVAFVKIMVLFGILDTRALIESYTGDPKAYRILRIFHVSFILLEKRDSLKEGIILLSFFLSLSEYYSTDLKCDSYEV